MNKSTIKYIVLTLLLSLCSSEVFCQLLEPDKYKISNFKFDSIYGVDKSDNSLVYCLLGKGFFKSVRSDNSDVLIEDWITKHPDAKLIPVTEMENFVYSWVVQGSDTLNIMLVREGAFPGGTMIRPRKVETSNAELKVLVSTEEYDKFLEKVKLAERYAFENKLGIWADFEEGEK